MLRWLRALALDEYAEGSILSARFCSDEDRQKFEIEVACACVANQIQISQVLILDLNKI